MSKGEEFYLAEYMAAAMYELVYAGKSVEYDGHLEDPANWYEWSWYYDLIHTRNKPRTEQPEIWKKEDDTL